MYYICITINNSFQKCRGKILIIYNFFNILESCFDLLIICNLGMKYKPLIYYQCQKISCETLRYLKYFIILFFKDVSCKVYSDFAKENICNARMKLTIFPNDVIFSILLQLTKLHPRAGQAQEEFIDLQGFTFRKKA